MNKHKIVARIIGGIGNQLFSYAAARRLAFVNNCELVIDDVSGFRYDKIYRRSCQLAKFSIPCRSATPAERMEPFSRVRRLLRKKRNRKLDFYSRDYIAQEVFDFDPRLMDFVPVADTIIEGYWQSENYFRDIADLIRQDLVIEPPGNAANQEIADKISGCESVAIHFRFFSPESNAADNLSRSYYENAITQIRDVVKNPHFFVFSDNPGMAASMLQLTPGNLTVVDHNHGEAAAYADLWLMQQCRHFIIANSTFSWWGAWLSEHSKKKVIAPDLTKRSGVAWWGFEGLLPQDWIKLEV